MKKKIFAVLAASAVAVSMFAFTGCGEEYDGSIPGKYEQKTSEELTEIIGNIAAGDTSGETTPGADFGMGFKVNLSGSIAMGKQTMMSGSVNMDYKATETAGKGTATISTSYGETSDSFSGTFYNENQYVYASMKEAGQTMNFGLDVKAIMEAMESEDDNQQDKTTTHDLLSEDTDDVTDPTEDSDGGMQSWLGYMLTAVEKYNATVGVDDRNGIKIKISLSKETIWGLLTDFGGEEIPAEKVEQLKEIVTFNKFRFDIYFAIDSDGNFSQASVVTDVKISMPVTGASSPSPTAASPAVPMISVSFKGYVEIYTHNDTVVIPDYVKDYDDITDEVITQIKSGDGSIIA